MIIGVTGKKGHGKNTVGDLVYSHLHYLGVPVRMDSFAAPIKTAAKNWFGFTEGQVNGSIAEKETIDPRWGITPREVMQKLGTEVARSIHPDVWARALVLRHQVAQRQHPTVVTIVTDLRFPNEAQWVRKSRGIVLYVKRPMELVYGDSGNPQFAQHASEVQIEEIGANAELVVNNLWHRVADLRDAMASGAFPIIDDYRGKLAA